MYSPPGKWTDDGDPRWPNNKNHASITSDDLCLVLAVIHRIDDDEVDRTQALVMTSKALGWHYAYAFERVLA